MTNRPEQRSFLVSKDLVVPLSTQQPVVLGRDPVAANFVLSDDRVSRVHAMLLFRDGHYLVKDLNSSNGTFLNGRRVAGTAPLKPGDRIGITPFSLEFVQPHATGAAAALQDHRDKFEGSITTLPVADLIQLLNATQQSGVLTITDTENRQADLLFGNGEIEQAHYDGKSGEDAVYALMRSRGGRFEFTKLEHAPGHMPAPTSANPNDSSAGQTVTGERQIVRRTQSLLLEGARLMDESFGPDTARLSPTGATTRDSSTAGGLNHFIR